MGKPHKHAELIKAWADGALIEVRTSKSDNAEWHDIELPRWQEDMEYRIKPVQTDLDVYGVESGDVWKISPDGIVITVRHVRSTNIMSLNAVDYDLTTLNILLFRRGVVDNL